MSPVRRAPGTGSVNYPAELREPTVEALVDLDTYAPAITDRGSVGAWVTGARLRAFNAWLQGCAAWESRHGVGSEYRPRLDAPPFADEAAYAAKVAQRIGADQ